MSFLGEVRFWNHEEGWGLIDSDVTPGGCWTLFTSVLVPGEKSLRTGQQVNFTFEAADQDGYRYRALEVWPADGAPVCTEHEVSEPSGAYGSTLTVTFEDEDDDSPS